MAHWWVSAFENPSGPMDSRPTAKPLVKQDKIEDSWSDKTILVTGFSAEIGVEVAHALAEQNATLYLTTRNLSKAQHALGDLAKSDRVHLLELDLSSLASVRRAAAEFLSQETKLNILIANAGVMARTGDDGSDTQYGTNHLALFLLINLLTPALKAATLSALESRVVIFSSVAHRLTSLNFGGKFGSEGVHAWSVHPGAVATDLTKYIDEEATKTNDANPHFQNTSRNLVKGATAERWAAVSRALEGKGAKHFADCRDSAEWKEGQHALCV